MNWQAILMCCIAVFAQSIEVTPPAPPVWDFHFNTTLAKTNPFNDNILWTKLYYDYSNSRCRFDFYESYLNTTTGEWPPVNFTALFVNTTLWYFNPSVGSGSCCLRSNDVPPISPWWLKGTTWKGPTTFRGMYVQMWEFVNRGSLSGIKYYSRPFVDGGNGELSERQRWVPLRSTNQPNDPGSTDYYDYVVGEQDDALFEVPAYCNAGTPSCNITATDSSSWFSTEDLQTLERTKGLDFWFPGLNNPLALEEERDWWVMNLNE